MKHLVLSLAATTLLSGAALAADLPAYEPPPVAVASPVVYDWTGFYVGAQGGWGWGDSEITDAFGIDPGDVDFDIDGGFLGGLAGAQWQWNWLVIGAEGEINWSEIDGEFDIADVPGGNFFNTDINWFGSVNAKLGLAFDRFMVYGTGGVSFANIETGQRVPGFAIAFEQDENYVGWTLGGGGDFALTQNIILGAQFRYYDFGDEDYSPGAPFTDRNQDVTLSTVSGHVTVKFP
jgi:outer membrane immunogenic protein